ncbi:MAG: hypothetical protein KDB03_17100 [Planctomycetales bacterium]|nr:hypothetical protein [Planctomycetales bacterium]
MSRWKWAILIGVLVIGSRSPNDSGPNCVRCCVLEPRPGKPPDCEPVRTLDWEFRAQDFHRSWNDAAELLEDHPQTTSMDSSDVHPTRNHYSRSGARPIVCPVAEGAGVGT